MKRYKVEEIRKLSEEEINQKIVELKKELLDLRFQLAVGNLENTAKIKANKINIAILKTVLNEK